MKYIIACIEQNDLVNKNDKKIIKDPELPILVTKLRKLLSYNDQTIINYISTSNMIYLFELPKPLKPIVAAISGSKPKLSDISSF